MEVLCFRSTFACENESLQSGLLSLFFVWHPYPYVEEL